MEKAICKKCGYTDEYEPEEFGLSYYESVGTCVNCNSDTYKENGELTRVEIVFLLNNT